MKVSDFLRLLLLVGLVVLLGVAAFPQVWRPPLRWWSTTGNSGTKPGVQFLGTTDHRSLVIKTNGSEAMRVDPEGNVGIGTTAPRASLHNIGDFITAGPWVDVRAYGARGDGMEDATDTINGILRWRGSGTIYIPPGTFRIDGTLVLFRDHQLIISENAVLKRFADASSTDPIIWIRANQATVRGRGTVQTENASPYGLIAVGAEMWGTPTRVNVNWSAVEGITIIGVQQTGNTGLHIEIDPEMAGSAFNNYFHNLTFQQLGTAIRGKFGCNANTFNAMFFYKIEDYCWHFTDTIENVSYGGFTHASFNLDRVVKAENARLDGWYNMQMEPGSPGKAFDFDSSCRRLHFFGHTNIAGGIRDEGVESTWLTSLQSSFPDIALRRVRLPNTTAASNPQNVTRKLEVFDGAGRSLGFIPIYDRIH